MGGRFQFDEEGFLASLGLDPDKTPAKSDGKPENPPVSEVTFSSDAASKPAPSAELPADKPLHLGHRERARERFGKVGGEKLEDYELLELLLFRAIPRGDTKATAKRLLKRFGTFAEVLGAPCHLLGEIDGVGPHSALELKIVAAAAERLTHGAVHKKTVLANWNDVIAYCRTAMAFEPVEKFRVLYLNKKNALIADEVQQEGIVDHTPAYPSKVVNRAYNLGATAIILVHNHPSGDPAPSRADIDLTRTIAKVAEGHGIRVLDHVIVGRDGHASLKGGGYF